VDHEHLGGRLQGDGICGTLSPVEHRNLTSGIAGAHKVEHSRFAVDTIALRAAISA